MRRQLPRSDSRGALSVSELALDTERPPDSLLENDAPEDAVRTAQEVAARLIEERPEGRRYEERDRVAEGGMGCILRVWDHDLHRHVAKKVVRDAEEARSVSHHASRLRRFLEEAQITSQLEHPAIMPVHDLGLDETGKLYFTMPLIKGQHLGAVFSALARGEFGWTRARCLHILIKVCEALGYAHDRHVVHRDIKPDNIMVGRFGETYIMDWGLARIVDPAAAADLADPPTIIHSDRERERSSDPGSPYLTSDGQVVGTPSYMAPEQAMGYVEQVGPWSDIYAVGAMLYQLLAGRAPYSSEFTTPKPQVVLEMVTDGPPKPLLEVDPDLPRPLVAIAERAMSREPRDRYPDVIAMARNLEAYLDDRPTDTAGRVEALQLALRRNRGVVATAAVAAVALLAVLVVYLVQQAADSARRLRMLDFMAAEALMDQADSVHVILPEHVAGMERWIARAEDLLSREARYRLEAEDDAPTPEPTGGERLEMLANMDAIAAELPRMQGDAAKARSLRQQSVDRYAEDWQRACEEISRLEVYGGLQLAPQTGLVPLRRDPDSGLWEFWVVASGGRPKFDEAKSGYLIGAEDGIVLVLIPGGEFTIGSPPDEQHREVDEVQTLRRLAAYFLGKYEVTQATWQNVMGSNPATYHVETDVQFKPVSLLHPVETVDWFDSQRFARRLGLVLPSEAEWEFAARAGHPEPYYGSADGNVLEEFENLASQTTSNAPAPAPWVDRWVYHAEVGRFVANDFGLHDMLANVQEWCADDYERSYQPPSPRPGRELHRRAGAAERVLRGGHWFSPIHWCRSALRVPPEARDRDGPDRAPGREVGRPGSGLTDQQAEQQPQEQEQGEDQAEQERDDRRDLHLRLVVP